MEDSNTSDSKETITFPKAGLRSGILLKERYRIDKELGAGGIGMVFLAKDTQLYDRPVVVKVLLEKSEDNNWIQKKFRQEIEALVRIKHPGVVGVFDAGQTPDGKLFVVMEFVEGVDLRSVLKGLKTGMGLERTANILRQIGPALTAAHDEGVFHCDLKPENIMLLTSKQGDELAKLIDFGVAKVKDSLVASVTETRIAGTFLYMAPEQLMGHPSAFSDIYALGVIAYEMLTLTGPFAARTVTHLYELQRTGVQVYPRQLRPDLPKAAEDAILRTLSFDPQVRYQRARDFTEDLSKALVSNLETEKVSVRKSAAPPILPTEPLIQKPKSNKTTFIMIPILIALVMGGYVVWSNRKPTVQKPSETLPTVTTLPPVPVKERQLNYYVEMQKYSVEKPIGPPIKLSGDAIFEKDYRVRLFFTSPESGYLYLLNEGPMQRYGGPSYNVLFPTPSTNGGSAQLMSDQSVQIPSQSWFRFDEEAGTEKLRIIWAVEPVPELEAVKGVVNPVDKGVVSNPDQLNALVKFFAQHSGNRPTVEKKEDHTVVRGKDQILVNLLKLEHY